MASTVTLSFRRFDTELGYDAVTVYDGQNRFAPQLTPTTSLIEETSYYGWSSGDGGSTSGLSGGTAPWAAALISALPCLGPASPRDQTQPPLPLTYMFHPRPHLHAQASSSALHCQISRQVVPRF